MVFNNGVWTIVKLQGESHDIPEDPFEVFVDGEPKGTTKLLAFARHVPNTDRFPQVLVLYSSGYLRLKAGADPTPPVPFGQSLVLGPAIWDTSTSYPNTKLFSNPQLHRVDIYTSKINKDGTNSLLIKIMASDSKLLPGSTKINPKTNRIMNLTWTLTLDEPSDQATMLDVAGTFEFTEDVTPDPERTAKAESVRLLQISTMYIDSSTHDVDSFRFRNADGVITVDYGSDFAKANELLPDPPSPLDPEILIFDSLHTDHKGEPNGNTPCYRITINSTTGFTSGPITVRAIFDLDPKLNQNNDNLGLWAFQQPTERIVRGTKGSINYTVIASTDPLPAIASDLDNACRYRHRGDVLAKRRQYETAIKQYQKAIKIDDKYVEAYNSWGWALANLELYDKAIQKFDEATKINKKYAEAYNSWGWALAKQAQELAKQKRYPDATERYKKAIEQYKKATTLDNNYSEAYNSWGWTLVDQNKYEDAISPFKKAIDIRPSHEKYNSLGFVFANLGRYIDAISQFKKAIKLNKKDAHAYNNWGWVLANQGLYENAIPLFEKATKIDSKYTNAYNNWGLALANQGHFDEAITKFKKATKIDSKYANAYNNWGWALAHDRHYDEAFEQFEKATKIDPECANAYNNWGWALAHDRRYDEAIEKYQKAIDIDGSVNAYHSYAKALWDQGKYHQGIEKWKKTRQVYEQMTQTAISDKDSNFFYNYGAMLHEIFGDFKKSKEAYEKGRELNPNDALIYIGLAHLCLEEKDSRSAGNSSRATDLKHSSTDPKADAYWHARDAYGRAESLINVPKNKGIENLFLLQQLAQLHLAMKEYNKASDILNKILENNHEYVLGHAGFGTLYMHQKYYKAAIEEFETANRNDPYNLTIRTNLAEAYRNDEQLLSAETEYKEILSVAPEHIESHMGLGEVYTAMGDAEVDSELYNLAICHFQKGIEIATNGTGKRLTTKKLAAAYYSLGYARVKLYEVSDVRRDESFLRETLKDFKNCFINDPDHHKAKIAQEKLEKRLRQLRFQRFAETIASGIVVLLSMFVFIIIQFHFFSNVEIIKVNYGNYALLTFGSILLVVAGLFLPHVLKLKVGASGIELEKSPVEQITTSSSLDIKNQSESTM